MILFERVLEKLARHRELGFRFPSLEYHSEEKCDLRLSKKQCLSLVAGLLFAIPIWAAHSNTIPWTVSQPITIGGTEIKPGGYVIKVDDGATQLQVFSGGKVVAQVPCQWTQLSAKAQASEVDVDGGKVTQIKIAGKTSALSFNN